MIGLKNFRRQFPGTQDVSAEQCSQVLSIHPVLRLVPRNTGQEEQQVSQQVEVDLGDELEQKLDTGHLSHGDTGHLLLTDTILPQRWNLTNQRLVLIVSTNQMQVLPDSELCSKHQ